MDGSQTADPKPEIKPDSDLALDQLRAANEELQRRKVDAEKDRELFRELYGKASAHVSEVSKENNELHERVSLLEGKVKDGLQLIRGTYESRVRLLEEEVKKWKGMYEILMARDRKMQGDELRRRAAVEPELRAENVKLREELEILTEDYEKMEKVLEQLGEQELKLLGEQELEEGLQKAVQCPSADDVEHFMEEGVVS
ncbi:unnamed protein product [Somion occarium]|uniref:Uncharacterized protein n=1 Tax=Somion occarium TaxID=3059160 RepID=A0ABP1CTY8_9APHY